MAMKIVITSGGTSEKIDSVRSITNHATGRLGSLLTETFLQAGHQVTLITTPNAIKPKPHQRLKIISVTSVNDTLETLKKECPEHQVCIHSMAISDYTPVYMTDFQDVKESHHLEEFLEKKNSQNKISSQSEYQVLFLKKTPKIIGYIKKWNPNILLIGFKLLVDVTEEHLIEIARTSLKNNQADYILANDFNNIKKDKHQALLISETDIYRADTKQSISKLILEKVENHD